MTGLRPSSTLVLAAVALLLTPGEDPNVPAADAGVAQEELDECTVIDQPGEYVVADDILHPPQAPATDCFLVRADDVVIDGGGRSLVGHGASDTMGIHVVDASNVTVRNFHLSDWHRAIHFENVDGGVVENVTVEDSVFGIALQRSNGVAVRGCRIADNFFGVWTAASEGITFSFIDNAFEGNTVDFDDTAPPDW